MSTPLKMRKWYRIHGGSAISYRRGRDWGLYSGGDAGVMKYIGRTIFDNSPCFDYDEPMATRAPIGTDSLSLKTPSAKFHLFCFLRRRNCHRQ